MAITAKLSGAETLTAVMEERESLSGKVKGPFSGGGVSIRLTEVTILASAWEGTESPWSQVVSVAGATKNSLVDLQPSVEQLTIFHEKDLAFVTENDDGVITVYAVGDKPMADYTIQATVTEVVA